MVDSRKGATPSADYDRAEEVKAFDKTKAGVKGLLDSGVQKVPRIFITSSADSGHKTMSDPSQFQVPVIDLNGIEFNEKLHEKIVNEIKSASEKWGFFQVVNHGVPLSVLEGMINGVIRFNEEDDEVKTQYYSRDRLKKARFSSNFDLYRSKTANWRDTLSFLMLSPDPIDPVELPVTCRGTSLEYTKHVVKVGDTLIKLLSEALGLKPNHLKEMECDSTYTVVSHYYPACPEPELTLGATKHTDPAFLTILLQDQIGGLQVLHQDHWVDVKPIPGAFVVNIGDLLQITSNDKLKSVEHRVLANPVGPRISVATFITTLYNVDTKICGPIKELLSAESKAIYKDTMMKEYIDHFFFQGLDGKSGLDTFKI